MCARGPRDLARRLPVGDGNISERPMLARLSPDGVASFVDDDTQPEAVDVVIYATG